MKRPARKIRPETKRLAPLRIVMPRGIVEPLSKRIQVPNRIISFQSYSQDDLAVLLEEAEVLIGTQFKASWLRAGRTRLRLIHSIGAGTDNIDFSAVPPGCLVCNVYGHERAIAEHTLMMMAALNRQLFAQDAALREGNWGDRSRPLPELRKRTLLILGLGHIGAEVARWARFIGMSVVGVTRSTSPERARQLGLEALGGPEELVSWLEKADFVLVAVPLLPETRGMIGEREFRHMKQSAYLINVARGPIVDEAALYQALRSQAIAGAAIDVWYRPPDPKAPVLPSRYPFHQLDNIIMTPSLCGFTDETMNFRWDAIAENLRRFVESEPLTNVCWPQPQD